MIKMISLLRRDESLTHVEFLEHWQTTHTNHAEEIPGLRQYATSVPLGNDTSYDGITELWFHDEDSMREAFDSAAGQRAQADAEQIIAESEQIVVDECIQFDR